MQEKEYFIANNLFLPFTPSLHYHSRNHYLKITYKFIVLFRIILSAIYSVTIMNEITTKATKKTFCLVFSQLLL